MPTIPTKTFPTYITTLRYVRETYIGNLQSEEKPRHCILDLVLFHKNNSICLEFESESIRFCILGTSKELVVFEEETTLRWECWIYRALGFESNCGYSLSEEGSSIDYIAKCWRQFESESWNGSKKNYLFETDKTTSVFGIYQLIRDRKFDIISGS